MTQQVILLSSDVGMSFAGSLPTVVSSFSAPGDASGASGGSFGFGTLAQCVELKLRWRFCLHTSTCPEIYL